jgi:hypothetical protein
MKCTHCSRRVKPIVALDGVLADYHEALVEFICDYTGMKPGPEVPLPIVNTERIGGDFGDWVCFAWSLDRKTYREIKLAFRQGGQKRFMPVYEGAAELAAACIEEGAEVWVTTARPYLRLDNVDPDTREWLRRSEIAWDFMVYGEDKYDRLAQLVDPERVVAVLDDLPEMYDQAVRAFGPDVPILRKNAWNKGAENHATSVDNLWDARALIVRAIQNWTTKNH